MTGWVAIEEATARVEFGAAAEVVDEKHEVSDDWAVILSVHRSKAEADAAEAAPRHVLANRTIW